MIKFIIAGKQASGKTELLKEFEKQGFNILKTHTDRPKRTNDEDNYIFHDKIDTFPENAIADTIIGACKYYTTKEDILNSDVMILNPNGIEDVLTAFPNISFIILYVNGDETKRQNKLKERNIKDSIIKDREIAEEITFEKLDKMLINNQLDSDLPDNMIALNVFENNYEENTIKEYTKQMSNFKTIINKFSKIIKRAIDADIVNKGDKENTVKLYYTNDTSKDRSVEVLASELIYAPNALKDFILECIMKDVIK